MNVFNENYQMACEDEENILVNLSLYKEEIELFQIVQASVNSSLTGLKCQIPCVSQGISSSGENGEEKVNQSKEKITSIFNNKNHKRKKTKINPNGDATNYQTN